MVVITRAAAARQRQSCDADSIVLHHNMNLKNIKKKKKVVGQHTSPYIDSSPLQLDEKTLATTGPSASDTFPLLSFNTPNSNECLIKTPITEPTSSSKVDLCGSQNDNDIIGINDNDECFNLPTMEFNQIDNNERDILRDVDDNEESYGITSWPITIGEIQWCKTNRGNDRMCMCGYSYDFMSQSLKKNIRYFRCSKKGIGCRAVVQVSIDSNMYNDSNNVEHNHPPDYHNVKRLLVLHKIKQRVTIEPTSVTRIIEDEYVKHRLNDGDRQHFLLPASQGNQWRYN